MKVRLLLAVLSFAALPLCAAETGVAWVLRVDYDSEEIVLQVLNTKEVIVVCPPTQAELDFFALRVNWITAVRFECRKDKNGLCMFSAKPRFFLAGEEMQQRTIVRPAESEKVAKRAP